MRPSSIDVHLHHLRRALAQRRCHTVGAGVAAAEDHHPAALGRDGFRDLSPRLAPVLIDEIRHGKLDALEPASRDCEIPRRLGTQCQANGIVLLPQRGEGQVNADVGPGAKGDPLRLELLSAAPDLVLGELEVGEAIDHETADGGVALEDSNQVARTVQLLGGRQPGGAAAHDRHPIPSARSGRLRYDPALRPPLVHDGALDALDGHRRSAQGEHAGGLAGCGTGVAGKLGKIIGRMEPA
jgi:hypothetical protein